MNRSTFNPADRAVLLYDAALFVLIASARERVDGWELLLVVHALLAAAVVVLAALDRSGATGAVRSVHLLYPIILLLWFYPEVGVLRHTLVHHDLDPLVANWNAALFGSGWHRVAARRLPVAALDVLHGVYFSYYGLVFVPAFAAVRKRQGLVAGYVTALTTCLLAHYAFGIVFPVSGPLAERTQALPSGGVFLPLMEAVYRAFDRGGMAFPSTHVAVALLAAWWAGRFFPRQRWTFALWAAAIVPTTVLCGYHYAIDAVAGLATGLASIALSRRAAARAAAASRS